mmetsp:Transcript_15885/g.23362  ORF Transcript_15885/g.23362 Transcript_15885/m.23362 type:complete len:258 (+) Transcript_15885:238-1011(+)
MSSVVMRAWRALLYCRVSFSIISPAFLEAFSMAFIREDCSAVAASITEWYSWEATIISVRSCMISCLASGSTSYSGRLSFSPVAWSGVMVFRRVSYEMAVKNLLKTMWMASNSPTFSVSVVIAETVAKLMGGVRSLAMTSMRSPNWRRKMPRPFSPITQSLASFPDASIASIILRRFLPTTLFTPPHRPRSEVMAMTRFFWGSPLKSMSSMVTPDPDSRSAQALNGVAFSSRCWSPRSLEAETIFIEDVILLIFLVA